MITRRRLVAGTLVALGAPRLVLAQSAGKVYQVAWLSGSSPGKFESDVLGAFRQRLKELGWEDGRNIRMVYRHAEGHPKRLPVVAAELVRMNVDIILATAPAALVAAREVTKKIPIVMVYGPDPVHAGVVGSLAHPGGNITGVTSLSGDLTPKQLDLLKQLVPGLSRVAVILNPTNPWHGDATRRLEAAGRVLGVHCQFVKVAEAGDLDAAFAAIGQERAHGVLILSDPVTFTNRGRLADLALKHRLPMMNGLTEYTEAGGLASYWPNSPELFRSAAGYVDRILRGARPGDLPIEQPTKFEFVINLKTARALGLTVPPALLARADRLIE